LRDLSLHILDIIENSIAADATVIAINIVEDVKNDLLTITIEDNGHGLKVSAEQVLDPFYTTKSGKRTGLGLSLFKAAAERAGGHLVLTRSRLGGLAVKAVMQLNHIDRSPLGDLPATFSSIVCTNPDIDLWCRIGIGDRECVVRVSDLENELPDEERCGLGVARRLSEKLKTELQAIGVKP
jgi:hypothetical protein